MRCQTIMEEKTDIQVSIVVPVYNSEQSLEELYIRIKNVFEKDVQMRFELILIDDSSKDNSFVIMQRLHSIDKRVKAIQLAKNCGQHAALLCGLNYTQGEFVVTMDDDLQHPPEEIPKLIEYIKKHEAVDVVIGKYESKKHNIIRNMGTALSNIVSSYIFKKRKDLQLTSFRIMRRFVAENLCKLDIRVPRIGNMLLQVSNRIENVIVEHDARKYGKSGYVFFRLVKDLINNIVTNSVFPLIVVRYLGLISFGISIILAIYYFVQYMLYGVSIQGWTTLVLLILLYSGLILLAIGIIGDYLMRILNESKKVPNYFVRKELIEENVDIIDKNED